MRKITLFILLLVAVTLSAKPPKTVNAARNSVASVLVFKGGELLRSGLGVFVGNEGEMLSSHSLFIDCDSAVTIDPRGVVRPVMKIFGADEMYDCIRVTVTPDKKLAPLAVATRSAAKGEQLFMVAYGAKKSGPIEPTEVIKVDTITGAHSYYTVNMPAREKYVSAPLLNANGELVALLQPVAGSDTAKCHALSASFIKNLTIKAVSYNSNRFARIGIKKALPPTESEALSCLLLQSFSSDSTAYKSMLDEFMEQFPTSHQGYLYKAEYNVMKLHNYSGAIADWEKALTLTDKKGEVWYHRANTIYANKLYADSVAGTAYSIDSAMTYATKAVEANSEPVYVQLKGNLHYTMRDYAAAFECYSALSSTNLRSADNYVLAANCKEILGDSDAAILQLDSAISTFGRVPITAMAPYVLNRGLVKYRAGRYREAVIDYNIYANLLSNKVNANFYYMREQAEYNGKMYRLALADIDMAIELAPENILFLLEKGRICYRVNMIDDAIPVLQKAIALAPDNADAYYILARCQMEKGNKVAAKQHLEKAVSLGHPNAASLLQDIK